MTAYRDIPDLEINAPAFIEERGYRIISYDGYAGEPFDGGHVYYQVRDTNDYLYSLNVSDWRGKYMIYGVKCLNAVKNSN